MMDWQVVKFLTGLQYAQAARSLSREDKIKMLREAITENREIEILYLKAKDEKSRRVVRPITMGEMQYNGHDFLGLVALCSARKSKRTFNVDKILTICDPSPETDDIIA